MIDLGDLTRAIASGLIFTFLVAGVIVAFGSVGGCSSLQDSFSDRGYDTSGIWKRQDIPSQ